MSKTMFANPKAALGFAGFTIAIAIAASFGASAFFPGSDRETEVIAETEAVPETRAESPPVSNAGWADEGLSDDWDQSSVDSYATSDGSSAPGEIAGSSQPEFSEFAPQSGGSPRGQGSSRSASAPTSGPRVTSGAARGAPPLNPPGGSGSGELEQVD